jgi:hypothetical protein
VTVPIDPSATNGWRGELEITDHDGGAGEPYTSVFYVETGRATIMQITESP